MSENLIVNENGDKREKYKTLIPQIKSLIQGETNLIANLANVCAALKYTFNFFWTGFYLVEDGNLVLAPFQGPIACTRIKYGKGVCGTSLKQEKTIVVPDVEKFPGHIACSSLSRSEIVVPLFKSGKVIGVLDIDSAELNTFDEIDAENLEVICGIITGNE